MSKEDLEWLIKSVVETGLRCQYAANVRSSITSKKQTDQKVGRKFVKLLRLPLSPRPRPQWMTPPARR